MEKAIGVFEDVYAESALRLLALAESKTGVGSFRRFGGKICPRFL
jgi:hypothetical protein